MPEWILCPTCNLKHSRRPDGRCPRCRESVDRDAPATAPDVAGQSPPPSASLKPAAPARPTAAARPAFPAHPASLRPSPAEHPRFAARGPVQGEDTWLVRSCRTRAVRRLLTCGLVVALALGLVAVNARYVRNFLAGPYAVSGADLDALGDAEKAPRYFVRVQAVKAMDTGLEQYEVRTRNGREVSRSVAARYFALLVGSRLLVVKSSAAAPTTVAEGSLERMPAELQQHLFADREMQAIRARFYPFYLDGGSFRSAGYWTGGIGALLLLITAAVARTAWKRLRHPESHPLLQRVAAWGDPVALSGEIERELARPWRRSGAASLTERFVVSSSFYSLDVLRLSDLLWAYKRVTKKSVNFIPTGKDYHAIVVCAGGTVEIQGRDSEVDETLRFLAARVPWAVFGHTKEIEELLGKDPAGFAAAVGERRRQYESGQQAASA